MTSNVTCRLRSINPGIGRILKRNQCLCSLKYKIISRACSSVIASRYREDKYGELRNRLAAVPYLKLLNKEVDRVHNDFCYEDDKRLEAALKRCSEVFNYNARDGKMIRGVAVLKAYCTYGFSMDDATWMQWDSDSWKSAIILAWCVELMQAWILMLDDIMDQSSFRRGRPCWYAKPEIGMSAINDALLLQCGIFKLLEMHFGRSKCYMNLVQEFHQVTQKTVFGQCRDLLSNPVNEKPRIFEFTFETLQTIIELKTAYYTFCLPIHLAMHLAGGYSAEEYDFTRQLCLKLGSYFQCQDDFIDCFGNSEQTGKFGNDIREGKCTWFSVKFLEEASEPMKKQFMENYGVDDKDAIDKVLELYRKANLLERFEEFDQQLCAEIGALIESMDDVKGALYYDIIVQLQNREK